MRREDQRRLAVRPHLPKPRVAVRRILDQRPKFAFPAAQTVEMRKLGADAAEIVPHAVQDFFDLLRRFLRESGAKIVATQLMFTQMRAGACDQPRHPVADAHAIEIPEQLKDGGDQHASAGVDGRLDADGKPTAKASKRRFHCEVMLPVRAPPWPESTIMDVNGGTERRCKLPNPDTSIL